MCFVIPATLCPGPCYCFSSSPPPSFLILRQQSHTTCSLASSNLPLYLWTSSLQPPPQQLHLRPSTDSDSSQTLVAMAVTPAIPQCLSPPKMASTLLKHIYGVPMYWGKAILSSVLTGCQRAVLCFMLTVPDYLTHPNLSSRCYRWVIIGPLTKVRSYVLSIC